MISFLSQSNFTTRPVKTNSNLTWLKLMNGFCAVLKQKLIYHQTLGLSWSQAPKPERQNELFTIAPKLKAIFRPANGTY